MRRRNALFGALALLCILTIAICIFVFVRREPVLTVAFLDVGQGDAIFIESPTGLQMLIDGGRDRSVLRELGKRMSPFDRSLDLVVETHPDADHIGGLPEVFSRYRVTAFLSPGIENDTSQSEALDRAVLAEEGVEVRVARRGMRIELGEGAYADILFPDRDVSHVETNSGSVILRVVYGESEFVLTGDAPVAVENYVVSLDKSGLQSEVLKAGHHGSRTSTGEALLAAVTPEIVVISAGKDNSYGHPHEEVLSRVRASGARLLKTMGEGTVVLVSDGKSITEQ
ncbi:MAG: MBL fold metallo-hydrolase [Minisyncoccia bacterium]